MLPPGLAYSIPNLPSSVTNFGGPVFFSREKLENINCIIDPSETRGGLFLGDTLSVKRIQYLIKYNVQAVLSCAPQAVFVNPGDPKINIVATKFICALDSLNYDLSQHFEETYQFIEENLSKKINVLVHCHAGVSRSAAVVIAFIMKKYGLNFEASFEMVKARRPRIRPNQRFRAILKEYQQQINLNSSGGDLTETQRTLMGKSCYQQFNNIPTTISSSFSYPYQKPVMINGQRISQQYINAKNTPIISTPIISTPLVKRQQQVRSYQPSGLSITQLLMKADLDSNTQRQLEYKLNEVNTQLQNETHSLFGKEQLPKRTIQNINQINYGMVQTHQIFPPRYSTQKMRPRMSSQRPVQYQPIQTQSIRNQVQRRMNQNKAKTTVVQGGLPDSYKQIAGSMAPSSNRYESNGYYERRY